MVFVDMADTSGTSAATAIIIGKEAQKHITNFTINTFEANSYGQVAIA